MSDFFKTKSGFSINPSKTKHRPLYLQTQSYLAINAFHLGYKNQSVYSVTQVDATFSDKYNTHKYRWAG
jgi:hypothetical protein